MQIPKIINHVPMKTHAYLILLALMTSSANCHAQGLAYAKLSPWVRNIVMGQTAARAKSNSVSCQPMVSPQPMLTAFVKTEGDADSLYSHYGCKVLLRRGNIDIVAMPIANIAALSSHRSILRIEANQGIHALMDHTASHIGATKAYQGLSLPQAYTGNGVMVGVVDVGFDLTHPNFYDASASHYRIRSLWDQLSADTLSSPHYVGNSYHGTEALLAYAHSRDGIDQTHGTHTLGSLAGSGYNSPYRGIAYESDMCIVSNAITDDIALIDSADLYKYTYATDVLGFKYIFDTADSLGMPCVISFSEGSLQDFRGDDQLYYAMLDSLVGPGRIIVSSAGNEGMVNSYIHKPKGKKSVGSLLRTSSSRAAFTVDMLGDALLRIVAGNYADTLVLSPSMLMSLPDSMMADTLHIGSRRLVVSAVAYVNCYDSLRHVVDVQLQSDGSISSLGNVSVEMLGEDADAELYRVEGALVNSDVDSRLANAECTHNILSPSASPSVICVGANSYSTGFVNYLGQQRTYNMGTNGIRGAYSSVGPTYDGRIKPDVMAPGTNVVSSYSSYYLEHHPDASDILSDVEHFRFRGRTYSWNANSGTSMSSPVAAGVIALWLQANPKLTPADVLGIIARTSRHPDATLSYPNNLYGYGEIDAYAGLLDILGISSIDGIDNHMPHQVAVSPMAANKLRIDFAEVPAHPVAVTVYALSGMLVATETIEPQSQTAIMSLPQEASGVVVVQTIGDKPLCGSQLVRLHR